MAELSFQLTGGNKLGVKVQKLKSMDLKPEFKQIGEYLKQYYSGEAFISQGQVFGKPWEPIKGSAGKSRKYVGQPLERSGKMRDNFQFDESNSQVRVFNPTPYFPYHQSSAPRRVLPRRVMLGFNMTIKSKAKEVISDGIKRIINE